MASPHPLSHILRAIADGKTVQWRWMNSDGVAWVDYDHNCHSINSRNEWRIKPKMKYQVLYVDQKGAFCLSKYHYENASDFMKTNPTGWLRIIKVVEETAKEF